MVDCQLCRYFLLFKSRLCWLTTVFLSALLVTPAANARDSLEDILREGVRIILGGQNQSSGGSSSASSPDRSDRSDSYYIDYRIKRRLNGYDQSGVAEATRRALDTGQSQRWRNRRAGVTVLVSVSDVTRYDTFEDSRDNRYGRDERNYSTYPDGQYQRADSANSRWRDDDEREQSRARLSQVPALLHVDDWYRVTERATIRKGPGRRYETVASIDGDEYIHVVGVIAKSRYSDRQRRVWVFVDEGGTGVGFMNANRLAPYRKNQTDLIELVGAVDGVDGYGNEPQSPALQRKCRSLTQRLVASRIDESYTSTWCLTDNNKWETVQ